MTTPQGTKGDIESLPNATLVEPLLPPENPRETPAPEPVVVLTSDPSELAVLQESFAPEFVSIDESSWEHGEVQPPAFRNAIWAVLFLGQIVIVTTLAVMAVVSVSHGHYDFPSELPSFSMDRMIIFVVSNMAGIIFLSAVFIFLLLGPLADMMIQLSLVLSPISCGLSSLGALLMGRVGASLFLALFCALGTYYAVRVWNRIPFASANLAVALEAIKKNKGLIGLAYATTLIAMIWLSVWALAVTHVSVVHSSWVLDCKTSPSGEDHCEISTSGKWICVGMLFSLYWTSQVITNVFHTCIAGVVGTFWFAPSDAQGNCWNPAITDSWVRSTVYSLGSICLGSLLVAVLQVLQVIVAMARNQRNERGRRHDSVLWCLLQFIVDHLERLIEYVNSWAFIYVGLYGYEYSTAAQKVYRLFMARGWGVIIDDRLVGRSLGLMQLFIGLVSGAFSVITGLVFLGNAIHPFACFSTGVVLGMILSNIQLGIVSSAVLTVIVCFAEAPTALMENHPPELSSRMFHAWREAYPSVCGF
eukprot:Nitzschia sp. Nitz4//scaffold22_size323478//242464//244204//NITZ4_000569-RA/size323478-processed-gene-0.480-mRNA-1//-1//CDS//3329543121//4542//frame0